MKYDPKKTSQRLRGIPVENRAFIYDATILLEFLNQTFMPNEYFEKMDPKEKLTYRLSIGDIYEYYKMFRDAKDYTAPIESRYKISVMLKKLLYEKNGWQFDVRRVGRGQLIYFSPLLLRVKVDPEIKKNFPPKTSVPTAQELAVEVTKQDHEEEVPEEVVEEQVIEKRNDDIVVDGGPVDSVEVNAATGETVPRQESPEIMPESEGY